MNQEQVTKALAEHMPTASIGTFTFRDATGGSSRYCTCGFTVEVLYSELGDDETDVKPLLNAKLAAHQFLVIEPLIGGQA